MRRLLFSLTALVAGVMLLPGITQAAVTESGDTVELPSELQTCLAGELGATDFQGVVEGDNTTIEDIKDDATRLGASEECFDQADVSRTLYSFVRPPAGEGFAPNTASCLESTLGSNYQSQLQAATGAEAKSLRKQVGKCFSPGVNGPPLPPELKGCLEAIPGFDPTNPDASDPNLARSCFQQHGEALKHLAEGPRATAEQQSCMESILGGSPADVGDPSEDQKIEIGKKCFDVGHGPGPKMPEAVKSCLEGAVGDVALDPSLMTEDQRDATHECFAANDFHPGKHGDGPPPGFQPDPEIENCFKNALGGKDPKDATAAEKRTAGEQCFGHVGFRPDFDDNPHGDRPDFLRERREAHRGGGPGNDCIKRILGSNRPPKDDAERQKIQEQCFGGFHRPDNPPRSDDHRDPNDFRRGEFDGEPGSVDNQPFDDGNYPDEHPQHRGDFDDDQTTDDYTPPADYQDPNTGDSSGNTVPSGDSGTSDNSGSTSPSSDGSGTSGSDSTDSGSSGDTNYTPPADDGQTDSESSGDTDSNYPSGDSDSTSYPSQP